MSKKSASAAAGRRNNPRDEDDPFKGERAAEGSFHSTSNSPYQQEELLFNPTEGLLEVSYVIQGPQESVFFQPLSPSSHQFDLFWKFDLLLT